MAHATADIGTVNYTVSLVAGHHALTSDERVAAGGQDAGASPHEILCAALGACTAITLPMYAQRKEWPLQAVHVALEASSSIALPREYPERSAYLVSGAASADGQPVVAGQMIVFEEHAPAVVQASAPSVLMLLGGAPVGKRFIEWNFVSSSRERIEQAKADWRAGRMKLPDADNKEFIPLPPDMHQSAPAMS